MWCIQAMDYYSAAKKNKIQIHGTPQMCLENIMLSQISQTERQILYGFICVSYLEQANQTERKQNRGYQGLGSGVGEMGRVSIWDDERVLEMDSSDGYITISTQLMPINCILYKQSKGYIYIAYILPQ